MSALSLYSHTKLCLYVALSYRVQKIDKILSYTCALFIPTHTHKIDISLRSPLGCFKVK